VSITDTGVGISDAQRVKLFKLFGCIQNVEHENNQGIGLGLVISEKIVKAFDGMIGMRSKKGVGSQFSFSILLKDQNKIIIPQKSKPGHAVDSVANVNPLMHQEIPKMDIDSYLNKIKFVRETHQTGKILIVDDEQYNLDILEAFFKILKVDNLSDIVTFCRDGEQSYKVIEECAKRGDPLEYSLILSDCNMPFLDGYEATRMMRSLWSNMNIPREDQPRIFAVTGHIEEHYIKKAVDSGMDHVFAKPLQINLLANLLFNMKFITHIKEQHKLDKDDWRTFITIISVRRIPSSTQKLNKR